MMFSKFFKPSFPLEKKSLRVLEKQKLLIIKRLLKFLITSYDFISYILKDLRGIFSFCKSKLISQVIKINKPIWHFSGGVTHG